MFEIELGDYSLDDDKLMSEIEKAIKVAKTLGHVKATVKISTSKNTQKSEDLWSEGMEE